MQLNFFGAARQVTGSCYLLEAEGLRIVVDCGMYQEREFRHRNWDPFPFDAGKVDFVLLTHSHLDHAGLLPKLVREGFSGRVLTTEASEELLQIVLMDSARIQEEDAAYKKRRHKKEGRKGPYPEVPLYTVEDAKACFPLLTGVSYDTPIPLNNNVEVTFFDAGHILGSAMIEIEAGKGSDKRNFVFSGDIGQRDKPLVRDPSSFTQADYVVMESTYGNRDHEDTAAVDEQLAEVINQTIKSGGNIVIPVFAIERAQEVMYHLSRLVRENKIPFIKIFLDSPMAVDVTDVFVKHKQYLDAETRTLFSENESPFRFPGMKLVRTRDESKAINSIKEPVIIMAGSGMCTGGRVKFHLVKNIARPESTILFVGYQASGTLGRHIVSGAEKVRIHGKHYPVRANIKDIDGFSAHADRTALLQWVEHIKHEPRSIFVAHGEEKAALSLAETIRSRQDWKVDVPEYQDGFDLD